MKQVLRFLLGLGLLLPGLSRAQSGAAIPGEVLLHLHPRAVPAVILREHPEFERFRPLSPTLGMYQFYTKEGEIADSRWLRELEADPHILQAQANHQLTLRGTEATIPNDAQFGSQWNFDNTGQTGTADADVDAPEAWDLATGQVNVFGDTLVVAIIDDGFDLQHEDLNIWTNQQEIAGNGIDDDGNGYVDDVNGWNAFTQNGNIQPAVHGTHVAGIAAARTDNGLGVAGVSWGAQMMPIVNGTADEAELLIAYGYILDQRRLYDQSNGAKGAFVVSTNTSFGVNFGDPANFPLWCAVYDSLGSAGIISAVATMNITADVDAVNDVPSACPSDWLLSVTNTTTSDQLSGGAAYGATTIDLGAPGSGILSTLPNDAYGLQTGTSMSSPHVAGAILLLHARACPALAATYKADPAQTALQLRSLLLAGTDSLPTLDGVTVSGGRLNLHKALLQVDSLCASLSNSCLPAYGLQTQAITDSSALLSWQAGDSAQTFVLRYRPQGDTSWIVLPAADSTILLLDGLERCQRYEWQVEVLCNGDSAGYLATSLFRTEGCCEAPVGRQVDGLTEFSAVFSWQPVFGADSYVYRLRALKDTFFLTQTVSDTLFSINSLLPCTNYEWQVAATCDSQQLNFSPWEFLRTQGCGACLDSSYCASQSTDTEFEWIEAVQLGDLEQVSGDNGGYLQVAQPAYQLFRDSLLTLRLQPGFAGFDFDQGWRIWLDINQDGVFSDSTERIFDSGGGVEDEIVSAIHLLDSLPLGSSRLRISMKFPGFIGNDPPLPCETFAGGEVEDYCVVVVDRDSAFCAAPAIDSIRYQPLTQRLRLFASGKADAYEWTIQGPSLNTSFQTELPEWEGTLALQDCERYEIQLRAICDGVYSGTTGIGFQAEGPNCTTCETTPYCLARGQRADSLWLEGFSLQTTGGPLTLITGPDNGYLFLGNQSLPGGSALSGWLLPGSLGMDSVHFAIWMDENQDGQWQPSEQLLDSAGLASDTLFLPALGTSTMSEITRLRIIVSREGLADACSSPSLGEVEDICFLASVGVEDEIGGAAPAVSIYPNPFSRTLHIESEEAIQGYRLWNAQGQLVQEGQWQPSRGSREISMPAGPAGVYWIQILHRNAVSTQQLLRIDSN